MTHSEIYTKFMIEYDKANVTSSYPSLTQYEIATILDKAYLALIALKLTGNNARKSTFESDTKSVSDLDPLVVTSSFILNQSTTNILATNEYLFEIASNFLYYLQGQIKTNIKSNGIDTDHYNYNVKLVSHEIAEKFKASSINIPWVKEPVCFIESNMIHVLVDPTKEFIVDDTKMVVTYIKHPTSFVDQYNNGTWNTSATCELNDSCTEELINLAISMALENVESSRLSTKLSINQFES